MNDTSGPIAGRLRRPGWRDPRLLVGLLLIAVSVVAVTIIVRDADRTSAYYAAKNALTPGTILTQDDVVVVRARVGSGYIGVIADAEPSAEPWGQVVTRVVSPGELLPASALVDEGDFGSRPVAVRTSLPLADGIERGALVDVYVTVEGIRGPETTLVGAGLVVQQVDRKDSAFGAGGAETVYVVVPKRDIPDFLDAMATEGDVSVVGLAGMGG